MQVRIPGEFARDRLTDVLRELLGALRRSDVLCHDEDGIHIHLPSTNTTGVRIVKDRVRRIAHRHGLASADVSATVTDAPGPPYGAGGQGLSADASSDAP